MLLDSQINIPSLKCTLSFTNPFHQVVEQFIKLRHHKAILTISNLVFTEASVN